jgi:hypothetical protein
MPPEELVDASLVGLALGELVCMPAMQDIDPIGQTIAAMQRSSGALTSFAQRV